MRLHSDTKEIDDMRNKSCAVFSLALDGNWELRHQLIGLPDYALRPKGAPLKAQVPGDVHLDLMKAGEIQDPLLRDNAAKCAWIGTHEWWYEKRFEATLSPDAKNELVFDGLCYVADIWINGEHVGSHLNMHTPLRINVGNKLRYKEANVITARLLAFDDSVLDAPLLDFNIDEYAAGIPDKRIARKRAMAHKALYSYGWDWTQGLSTCGIWRGVRMESTPVARLENLFAKSSVDGVVELSFETQSNLKELLDATAVLSIEETGGGGMELSLACSD